jgi:hypothetical protein
MHTTFIAPFITHSFRFILISGRDTDSDSFVMANLAMVKTFIVIMLATFFTKYPLRLRRW